MKNWSFARLIAVIVGWVILVCGTGLLWLLWRIDQEPATSLDIYIVVHPYWEKAFVAALILPPAALLISWLVLRRRG